MESPITKLRATEKMLEETKSELARTREELHNAKKRIERLTAESSDCERENITLSGYALKEAQIVTEIQELLADEIKVRLSTNACTREVTQLVESLAKLKMNS
jgi:hypothetical protein|nr:MAG TPA: hypothetical protein [Caudoviricetes sp.]